MMKIRSEEGGIGVVHKADRLKEYPKTCIDGVWCVARPINYKTLKIRIRNAWLVLTGKADAVEFYKQ